jgi:hypothetical protein
LGQNIGRRMQRKIQASCLGLFLATYLALSAVAQTITGSSLSYRSTGIGSGNWTLSDNVGTYFAHFDGVFRNNGMDYYIPPQRTEKFFAIPEGPTVAGASAKRLSRADDFGAVAL